MDKISINYNDLSEIRDNLYSIIPEIGSNKLLLESIKNKLNLILAVEIPKRHIEYDDIIFSNFACASSHVIPLELFWYEMVKLVERLAKKPMNSNNISDYWDFYCSTESKYYPDQTIDIQQLMMDIRNYSESSDSEIPRGFINRFNHFKIRYNIGSDITHVYCIANNKR